ncbi:extradiol dioxygenase [Trinickia violacea]|uniref:Extradiol dioxygenase n=1 Tax=Trinickia violacea TaxID=2571746 RepID=A0A4P8ISS8_9BURK|nr:VOC family protein [Trinickia violacea]QCP48909.1 extradiol dioxygenase [Trinickia violacea]
MKLDHATIVTKDLEAARHFFCAVAGLTEGRRPPFGVDGHWLYADGRPVIHLVEATVPSFEGALQGRPAPRMDHVAFRVGDGHAWRALIERLHLNCVPFEVAEVPLTGERQVFVALGPGVVIEFVTRLDRFFERDFRG